MDKFCTSCGIQIKPEARFCGACGAAVDGNTADSNGSEPASISPAPSFAPAAEPAISHASVEDDNSASNRSNLYWLGGVVAAVALLGALYYLVFLRHNLGATSDISDPVAAAPAASDAAAEKSMFAVTQANIRDRASSNGTNIIGKIARAAPVQGTLILGEDGTSNWLALANKAGFVSAVNLSETAPPTLSKTFADKIWITDKAIDILAQPDLASNIVDHAAIAAPLTLAGITANDFIEVKLKKGGVGYIADGARIAALASASGKPIALAFNPNTCSFGAELDGIFSQLGNAVQAERRKIESANYSSDDARDNASLAFDQKSHFKRMERSYNGLTLTAIAGHSESQSLYFADPLAKVLATFRAAGVRTDASGSIATGGDYSASINNTSGEATAYGKTELGCGL